jgi:hypothetical protein
VRKKGGSRSCACRLLFAIRNTAPPLTTCGGQNLRAKKKRSGTQPDTLIAKTPRKRLTLPCVLSNSVVALMNEIEIANNRGQQIMPNLQDHQVSDSSSSPSSPNISRYLEPTVLLAALVGLLYYWGWLYLDSFFSRLNIQLASLNLSPTAYIAQSAPWICVLLAIMICAVGAEITIQREILTNLGALGFRPRTPSLMFPDQQEINEKVFHAPRRGLALAGNLPIFAFSLMFFYAAGVNSSNRLEEFLVMLFTFIGLGVGLFLSEKRISVVHLIFIDSPIFKALAIVLLFSISTLVTKSAGEAGSIVQVQQSQARIDLTWKENPPQEIQGKELLLITHQGGKYYVIVKEKTLPKNPTVFVIEDDQIRFAVMKPPP